MTDNNDEPDIQNSGISNEPETAVQNAVPTEDKTLLRSGALADEAIDESTRKFAAPVDEQAQTALQNAPDTDPTKILSDDKSGEDETVAPAKRYGWRLVLVSLFYALMVANMGLSISQLSLARHENPFTLLQDGETLKVNWVKPTNERVIQIGDGLVSLNGQEIKNFGQLQAAVVSLQAGERCTAVVRRDGQLHEVEFVLEPFSLPHRISDFIYSTLFPATCFIFGFLIFLFKPNGKQSLLFTLAFAAFAEPPGVLENLSIFFKVVAVLGYAAKSFFFVFFLHFFLNFPERSPLLRRFPLIEYLIYLPILFVSLPYGLLFALNTVRWLETVNLSLPLWLQTLSDVVYLLYSCACLLVLVFTYSRANALIRRKLRIVVAAFLLALIPWLFLFIWKAFLSPALGLRLPYEDWVGLLASLPSLLIPLAFAYAIVRYQVIPVSFIVRRGLQYILAKNALRLLLILPVLAIVWNIAANPNRTLSEILLNNSFAFYSCIALAGGFFLLMRWRFNDWIDRRFFREQYNQERVLRQLTEAVAESDSLPKLSRLVSSKIQSALHPENVYLFFRDDQMNSDFSLGYTTSGTSDGSANLKLAADSPILRFMQRQRKAIDFPFKENGDLPNRESGWLRSINAHLLVPMYGTDGKLAGFFSLGEKKSEIPYTGRDKELLETLAHQIALVHENLSLKDRVRREQKIKTEVLSRFDEGNINLLKECPTCGRCYDRETLECADDNSELTFSLPVERTIENRYRLEKLLGRGGMGAVYEATDTRINRPVAIKVLSGAMFGNRDALRRFEREAQTAGKLNHRNIVTVFDYGALSTEGAFLVMELIKGETLSEVLKRNGKLDSETVVAWFGQVLDGLEAAHRAGIIHRDLKPDNIFVTRNEDKTVRLCILDFGLARFSDHEFTDSVTVPGTVMGTLGYMPPEQLRGEKVDERSDLFAAGVMIYESLYGEKPFAGKTYQELIRSMSEELVFDSREPFAEFFARALAQKAAARYASAGEMKYNLSNLNLNLAE